MLKKQVCIVCGFTLLCITAAARCCQGISEIDDDWSFLEPIRNDNVQSVDHDWSALFQYAETERARSTEPTQSTLLQPPPMYRSKSGNDVNCRKERMPDGTLMYPVPRGRPRLRSRLSADETNQSPAKKFPCPDCGERFARTSHVDRHLKTVHSNVKPFTCTFCSRTFSRKDNLKNHINTAHSGKST